MREFKPGERVRILNADGSPSPRTGALTGGRQHVGVVTENWEVQFDGGDLKAWVPSRLIAKLDEPPT